MKKAVKRNIYIFVGILILIGFIFGISQTIFQEKNIVLNMNTSRTDVINECGIRWKNAEKSSEFTHTEDYKYLIPENYELNIGTNKLILKTELIKNSLCLPFGSPNSGTNIQAPVINFNNKDYKTYTSSVQSNYLLCLGRYAWNAPETKAYFTTDYPDRNLLIDDYSKFGFNNNQIIVNAIPIDRNGRISSGSYSGEGCLPIIISIKPDSDITQLNHVDAVSINQDYTFKANLGTFGFLKAKSKVVYKFKNGSFITKTNIHNIINNEILIPIYTKSEANIGISITPYVEIQRLSYIFGTRIVDERYSYAYWVQTVTPSFDNYTYENAKTLITSFDVVSGADLQQLNTEAILLDSSLQEKLEYILSLKASLEEQAKAISGMKLSVEENAKLIKALQLSSSEQATIINKLTQKSLEQASMINILTTNLNDKAKLISQLTVENVKQAQLISEMKLSFSNQGVIIDALNKDITDDAIIIKNLNLNTNEQAELIYGLNLNIQEQAEMISKLELTSQEQQQLITTLQTENDKQIELNNQLQIELEKQKSTNYWLIILISIISILLTIVIILAYKRFK